jgi:hypothetical protein
MNGKTASLNTHPPGKATYSAREWKKQERWGTSRYRFTKEMWPHGLVQLHPKPREIQFFNTLLSAEILVKKSSSLICALG